MGEAQRALRGNLDPEAIRVPVEREVVRQMRLDPLVQRILHALPLPDLPRARRGLAAHALLLSEAMAPEVHAIMAEAKGVLGLANEIEIYQAAGFDDAGINAGVLYASEDPILVHVQGRVLTNVDEEGVLFVLGHELGHYLAHGPRWPQSDMSRVAYEIQLGVPTEQLRALASFLGMAMELTADRFGLLVGQDLTAQLKVEMVHASGLPSSSVTWDPDAYLDQCRELMEETLAAGESAVGTSHPEHNLRAYAAWLWSESDLYRELTGQGPGSRGIDEVNETLSALVRPKQPKGRGRRFGRRPGGPGDGGPDSAGVAGPGVGRRVIRTGPDMEPLEDAARNVGTVLGSVGRSIGKASKKMAPGLSKLKDKPIDGVVRALDTRGGRPQRRSSSSPPPDDSDFADPLAEDEADLLDRFAALEKEQKKPVARRPRPQPDTLADDEDDLLDRFAALERQAAPPSKPTVDPAPSDSSERELLDRLAELERQVKKGK